MATGIVSVAAGLFEMRAVAVALLAGNAVAYVALWVLFVARAARYPRAVARDFTSHERAPGYLTVVAGTCVLGVQLVVVWPWPAAAAVLWLLGTRPWRTGRPVAAPAAARSAAAWSPWRDRTVRVAAGVYAAQGLVYFLLVLWLPAVYLDAGLSDAAAGARLAVLTGASLPGTVLFPAWIRRDGSTRAPLLASTAMTFAGALGFALATTAPTLEWLWPALAGLGVCGMLVAAVVDTANAAPTSRTGDAAGAVLAVGYVLTALGPLLAGVVRDRTGTYSSAMLILPVITAAALLLAFLSPNLPSVRAVEEGDPAP